MGWPNETVLLFQRIRSVDLALACPQKEDFARADRHSFGGLGPPLARLPAQVEAELLELRELSLRHGDPRVNSRRDAPAANPFSKGQGARRSAACGARVQRPRHAPSDATRPVIARNATISAIITRYAVEMTRSCRFISGLAAGSLRGLG
jgi:hypothetical protein